MEESIYEMVEENNKMLKKLTKKGRWSTVFKSIKYIFILILILGSWYYIKPFTDQVKVLYGKVNETNESIRELKSKASEAFDFGNIFKNE
jgi:hypothetical protein